MIVSKIRSISIGIALNHFETLPVGSSIFVAHEWQHIWSLDRGGIPHAVNLGHSQQTHLLKILHMQEAQFNMLRLLASAEAGCR